MFPDEIFFTPHSILPDGNNNLTILIPIEVSQVEIPPEVRQKADQLHLSRKEEFHLTVVGYAGSRILNSAINAGLIDITTLETIVDSYKNSLELWQTLDYYVIEKTYSATGSSIPAGGQYRQSIINLIHAPILESLLTEINNQIDVKKHKLPKPFFHLTLFASGYNLEQSLVSIEANFANPNHGIGLNNEHEFHELHPKKIFLTNPEQY